MEISSMAQWRAWSEGSLPPVEEVRPGLWSIPVPIPINPLRYVNVYALRLPDGLALIDAGWDTPEAWEGLKSGLAATGYRVDDVRAVLVTHIHPDHYGLAARVRENSGAWIAVHSADARLLRERYAQVENLRAEIHSQLRLHGVPEEQVAQLGDASMGVRSLVTPAEPDVVLEDGESVPVSGWRLVTVWTPGHSPGHVCVHDPDRRLLFTGDHVLPRISPNVTVHAQQRRNPLADFLESLKRVRVLDVGEVLPAHEYRFRGLGERVDALTDHHARRLQELVELVTESPGRTGWELARGLDWSRPWAEIQGHTRRIALGETLAHLVLLASRGQVVSDDGAPQRWLPAH